MQSSAPDGPLPTLGAVREPTARPPGVDDSAALKDPSLLQWMEGLHQSIIDEVRHLQSAQIHYLDALVKQPMNELKQQQETLVLEFQNLAKVVPLQPSSPSSSWQRRNLEPIAPDQVQVSTNSEMQERGEHSDREMTGPAKPVKSESSMAFASLPSIAPVYTEEAEEEEFRIVELREQGSLGSVFSCDCDVERPAYNVATYYWKTGRCQETALSERFAHASILVVVFNAIYIGVESDYNDAQNVYEAHIFFIICSQFFCFFFTGELLVRLLAFEHKRDCLKDGWFKFDAFLVSTMILDTWVLMPLLKLVGGGVTIPTQPLRMLRLFKLTRMARLMKAFPELVTMIKGLIRSLRAVSSSMILVGILVYVWAIMMHMLMKEEHEFNDMLWEEFQLGFMTMTTCIWTLLMDGTLMLDNTAPIMTSLLFSQKANFVLAGIGFVMYSVLSAMLILQSLIGVLCDVVSQVGQEERDARAIGLVKQEILRHLKVFDGGDGKISKEELNSVMHAPSSRSLLKQLKIDRAFFQQLQQRLFTKPGQRVPMKACLDMMILCQGDNPTTVEAMSGGLLSIIQELRTMKGVLEHDASKFQGNVEIFIKETFDSLPRPCSQSPRDMLVARTAPSPMLSL